MSSRNDEQLDHWLRAVLLAVVMVGSVVLTSQMGTANPASSAPSAGLALSSSGTNFDYLVLVIMENHGIDQIINSAPFLTSFANSYALATRDTAVSHPSLPNYLALTGGSTFGCGGYDGDPNTNSCTGSAWRSINIVDRLEAAGLTWKAYMEDMPNNCLRTGSGGYVVRHNPFVYFNNVASNSARCSRVVPAGSSDKSLLNDLSSDASASNFMWLTPNICNDMHDCPVSQGDSYLSGLVPQILNSSVFKTKRAALIITFDEGNHGPPSDFVYTVFAGPTAKTSYTSFRQYDHYSLLRTIEDNWRLPTITSNDGSASNMFEFLQSSPPPPVSVSISWTPDQPVAGSQVNFSASATGGVPGYTYTWKFGDTSIASGATPHHSYFSPGSYSVEVTAIDSKSASATKSASMIVKDVNAPVPPVFTIIGNQSASIGNILLLAFRATPSSPDLKLAYSIVDGPRGAIIDQESGLFSWTPTVSDRPGTYRVIVRVSDNKQATSTQTVWVVLASSPPPPNLPSPSTAAPPATPATMTSSFITAIVSLAVVASGALVALGASRKLRRRQRSSVELARRLSDSALRDSHEWLNHARLSFQGRVRSYPWES